jgi:hypothetical protein
MAKYEKTRKYVVREIFKSGDGAIFSAPKGRAYHSVFIHSLDMPKRLLKALKVGKTVTFTRFSTRTSTWFAPKAK